MKTRTLVIGLLSVLTITSCQREVEGIIGQNQQVLTNNIYLSRVVELDTSYASGLDTFSKTSIVYDASKRLIKVNDTIFEAGSTNIEMIGVENRFYNGSDTMPYKFTRWEAYSNGEDIRDTVFFFYNTGGLTIIKDSTIQYYMGAPFTKTVKKYTDLGGGRYYSDRTAFDYTTGILIAKDSILMNRTYTAGNMSMMTDSVYDPFMGQLRYMYRYNYSYDTKNNPFHRALLPYMAQERSGNTKALYSNHASVNNPVSYSFTSIVGLSLNTGSGQSFYEYDSNNYPVVIRYSSSSFTNKFKTLLFYRIL